MFVVVSGVLGVVREEDGEGLEVFCVLCYGKQNLNLISVVAEEFEVEGEEV